MLRKLAVHTGQDLIGGDSMYCKVCNKYVASSNGGDKATTCVLCLGAGYKFCNLCEVVKPANEFGKDTLGRLRSTCKLCTAYKSANSKRTKYHTDNDYRIKRLSQNFNRKALIIENYTAEEWQEKEKEFSYSCAYCGSSALLTCDHIIPLSKGGRNIISNIVPACLSCNSSKNASDIIEWYTKQDFFNEARLNKVIGGGILG